MSMILTATGADFWTQTILRLRDGQGRECFPEFLDPRELNDKELQEKRLRIFHDRFHFLPGKKGFGALPMQ